LEKAESLRTKTAAGGRDHLSGRNALDLSGLQVLRTPVEFFDGERHFLVFIQGLDENADEPGSLRGAQS
jgi:hypothetical protein